MAEKVRAPLLKSSDGCHPQVERTIPKEERTTIGIIGTGNYGLALNKRLTMAGYDVIIGSRCPESRNLNQISSDCSCSTQLASLSECFEKCQIIFVAIHVEDFVTTLKKFTSVSKNKILIDVSNRDYRYAAQSNAEHLASVLPQAVVVKAFNSISSFTMENIATSASNHRVLVASNDPSARSVVGEIAVNMGFRAVDFGSLKSALYMEDLVLKVFSYWKIPVFLTFGIFNLWLLYIVYLYFIEATEFQWEQVFLKVLNKPLCMTAITVLALTYLPGHVAWMYQIYNGTKHKLFPRFLDSWLKSRKQLGLISFFLASIHVIASVLMLSPTYYRSWFHPAAVTIPGNTTLTSDLVVEVSTSWMIWKGEAACLAGIIAFVLMVIMGLTSIPSVGEGMNWSEWTYIHSKVSYAVLLLVVSHVCIMGAPVWASEGPRKTLKSITFLSIILPSLVLLLKIIFIFPPLNRYIWKIRRGWERGSFSKKSPIFLEKRINKKQRKENGLVMTGGCGGCTPNGGVEHNNSKNGDLYVNFQCQCSAV